MTLTVAIFQASAAGQQPVVMGPSTGQGVDVELKDGRHVIGTVKAWRRSQMSIERAKGSRVTTRYVDVLGIRDLDTGMMVAIPVAITPRYDTRWVKPVLLGAAAVYGFLYMFFVTCGFGGRCN